MNDENFENDINKSDCREKYETDLVTKIENAYRIYKLSEVFLNDVENDYGKDYGKIKIARLRLDFARHELLTLLEEAREKGVKWNENEFIKKFFYPNPGKNFLKDFR